MYGRAQSVGEPKAEPDSHSVNREQTLVSKYHANCLWSMLVFLPLCLPVEAAELQGLTGLDNLFGRYAPGGDCKRQPQILAEASGLTFFVGGKEEKVTNPEEALGFAGPDYTGPGHWLFPFRLGEGYTIMMEFSGDKAGTLNISGHDQGFPGGPPLNARDQALVGGSPYKRCK